MGTGRCLMLGLLTRDAVVQETTVAGSTGEPATGSVTAG